MKHSYFMDSTSAQPTTLDQAGFYTGCITFRLGQGDWPRGNWDVSGDRGDNWETYFQRNMVSILSSFLQNLTAASRAWRIGLGKLVIPGALLPWSLSVGTSSAVQEQGVHRSQGRLLPAYELGPTCALSARSPSGWSPPHNGSYPSPYSPNLDPAALWVLRALRQMAQPGLLLRLPGPAHSLSSDDLACPPLGPTH